MQEPHEWVNIQEVVRVAFGYVSQQLCQQEAQLKCLAEELELKVGAREVEHAISAHTDVDQLYEQLDKVAKQVKEKADRSIVDEIEKNAVKKTEFDEIVKEFEKFKNLDELLSQRDVQIELKINLLNAEFQQNAAKAESRFQQIADQLSLIEEYKAEQKENLHMFKASLDLKANRESVASALHRKANKDEIHLVLKNAAQIDDIKSIVKIIETKVNFDEFGKY